MKATLAFVLAGLAVAAPARAQDPGGPPATAPGKDGAAAGAPAAVDPSAPETQAWFGVHWYGIYAGDVKVGWMRRSLERTKREDAGAAVDVMVREIRVLLDVAGDGNGVENLARTVYAAGPPQVLLEAATQSVEQGRTTRREVVRREGRMDVATWRRGERVDGSVALLSVELSDEVAAERLAALAARRDGGPVGASVEATAVDLAALTESRRRLTVAAVRTLADGTREIDVSAGVGARAAEAFTTDGAGLLLRGTLGPKLSFRREPEASATDPSFLEKLRTASRIPLDAPLGDLAARERVAVAWESPGPSPFPRSPRQAVRREGPRIVLEVLRDADAGPADDEGAAAALRDEPGMSLSDPTLRQGAARVVAGISTRTAQVKKLAEFVRGHVPEESVPGTLDAAEVLARPRGDASERARLFIALCRATGIPAREVHGFSWLGDEVRAFGRHVWAEVVLDGKWRPVDPSSGQDPADAGHLAMDTHPQLAASLLGVTFGLVE